MHQNQSTLNLNGPKLRVKFGFDIHTNFWASVSTKIGMVK